jgi:hypothetical protein
MRLRRPELAGSNEKENLMNDVKQTVERYIAIWNETDPEQRRNLIARTWSENATYVDPLMKGDGAAGIDAMIAAVQERFPGYEFRLISTVDSHNDRVRFNWELTPGNDEPPLVAGVDFGVLAADGRLQAITGFLDKAP